MKNILFILFFLLGVNFLYAQEYIPDLEDGSTEMLNNELRKLREDIQYNSNAIDTINNTTTITFSTGMIMLWAGAITDIPSGWQLCDGTNGSPNLTDRFVIHADADSGGTRNVGDTGGAHNLTISESQLPSHTHTINHTHEQTCGNYDVTGAGATSYITYDKITGGAFSVTIEQYSGNSGSIGSGDSVDTIPKYYALAYIYKL